jgi:hypothetical protein
MSISTCLTTLNGGYRTFFSSKERPRLPFLEFGAAHHMLQIQNPTKANAANTALAKALQTPEQHISSLCIRERHAPPQCRSTQHATHSTQHTAHTRRVLVAVVRGVGVSSRSALLIAMPRVVHHNPISPGSKLGKVFNNLLPTG